MSLWDSKELEGVLELVFLLITDKKIYLEGKKKLLGREINSLNLEITRMETNLNSSLCNNKCNCPCQSPNKETRSLTTNPKCQHSFLQCCKALLKWILPSRLSRKCSTSKARCSLCTNLPYSRFWTSRLSISNKSCKCEKPSSENESN